MQEDIELLSCDPMTLYGHGTLFDGQMDLSRLVTTAALYSDAIDVLAEIFPHARLNRTPALAMRGSDPNFITSLSEHFVQLNRDYYQISPVLLVRLRRAIIWRNMLFVLAGDQALPIYEFYRQTDRAPKGPRLISKLAAAQNRQSLDFSGQTSLFIGSAGSFNYGHWLVDDLPSLACSDVLRRQEKPLKILMSGYDDPLNRIRMEGVALVLGERPTYSVSLLNFDTVYHVENLHYVTPVSYHPINKHPGAIEFVQNVFDQVLFDTPSTVDIDKIFINRSRSWPRTLVNEAAIREVVVASGFREVVPEHLSLREQWATFAGATRVVGIMGAGMTSSVLSPRGAHLTYLASSGWEEPFFWDLAAMGGQRYTAVFGPDQLTEQPLYKRAFSIDPDLLTEHLAYSV